MYFSSKKASILLMSMMVMSAVLSSAMYVNTLIMRQVRQAASTDNALVAFYAAESANEQAIYYIRQEGVDEADLIPALQRDELNPFAMSIEGAEFVRQVDNQVDNINISLKKDNFYQFDIFDPLENELRSNLNSLSLDWSDDCNGESWIELTVNEWTANTAWSANESVHVSKELLNNPPYTLGTNSLIENIDGRDLDIDALYQFRVKALYCNITNLTIIAYDDDSPSPNVIPFKNLFNISSKGEFPVTTDNASTQALSISLKKTSPISGLFDYVLFSEKSIVKDIGAYSSGWFEEELFISTTELPSASINSAYSHAVTAINGSPAYTWIMTGAMPAGFSIDPNTGVISGNTGAVPASYYLTVKVTDSAAKTAQKLFLLRILDE